MSHCLIQPALQGLKKKFDLRDLLSDDNGPNKTTFNQAHSIKYKIEMIRAFETMLNLIREKVVCEVFQGDALFLYS